MRLDDLPQVLEIDRISFSMPWPASAYRYEVKENPASLKLVAEIQPDETIKQDESPGSRVVGMIVVWLILDEAHIATIAVHPAYRRLKIAARLVTAALIEAIQKGMQEATLEVRASNLSAQKLYRKFGFELVGIRPRYYKDNHEDAYIMTVKPIGADYRAWLSGDAGLSGGLATPGQP